MKLTDLRSILQYIPRFREKIFVISVDGAIVTSENFANILLDVAVLRSLSIRVVLVHGAAAQIDVLAKELHIQPSNLDGSGVTDAPTLKLALTAANRLTHEILEGLSANDLRAVLGNDVAIKAYREGKLPFPDGTILAALHYRNVPSEENNKVFGQAQSFVPGAPTNIQFMVKDSKKYAATGGWGFGHFADGKPGDAAFMKSCFPCHEKTKATDLVFTRYAP